MDNIMVSVYCLAYNHEKYIRKTLEGFVHQKTDFSFEVIIHDDASTDHTAEIIREYEKKYPEIIFPIYQKENQYSQKKLIVPNYIYPKIRGKYIAVCEGDDYWCDESKLQMQVDFLENHKEYVACVHNTLRLDYKNHKQELFNAKKEDYDPDFREIIQGGASCYHQSSLIYKREILENRPDFLKVARGMGDYPLSIFLALSGKIHYFGKVMSVYRYGVEGSWTVRVRTNKEKTIHHLETEIEMLNEVDQYSQYKFHEIVQDVILHREYKIAELEEKYNQLKKGKFRKIYLKKSFKHKIKIWVLLYAKPLYRVYEQKHNLYQ
ncbi:glycosyltransferase family 2 protein [Ruminococcus sp. OM05-10BH]|nr:glycosyltransferase family 2 protein [Ruminococcus sp. OM05-10BH]